MMLVELEPLSKMNLLLKGIVDVKSRWILKDSWTQVVIVGDVIEKVFLVVGREPKQMLVHGKVHDAEQLFAKNKFLARCSKTMNNQE